MDMEQKEVLCRPARPDDVDDLLPLLEMLFALEEDFVFHAERQRRGLELLLASPSACVLVAEADGCVVGMCSGQLTISTAEGGPALLVEDVAVALPWRGQGIAPRLLDLLAAWATQQGAGRMQLVADRNNTPALAFYDHLGWRRTQLLCLRKYTV